VAEGEWVVRKLIWRGLVLFIAGAWFGDVCCVHHRVDCVEGRFGRCASTYAVYVGHTEVDRR